MKGQVYQECNHRVCHTEPVCVYCEYCEVHCLCSALVDEKEIQAHLDAEQADIKTMAAITAGFDLIEKYVKEFGQDVISPRGEIFHDARPYFVGIGYGTGSIYSLDNDQTICLSIHTGSDVVEWASRDIVLPLEEFDDSDNGNADIVRSIKQLAVGNPLTPSQIDAFTIA